MDWKNDCLCGMRRTKGTARDRTGPYLKIIVSPAQLLAVAGDFLCLHFDNFSCQKSIDKESCQWYDLFDKKSCQNEKYHCHGKTVRKDLGK